MTSGTTRLTLRGLGYRWGMDAITMLKNDHQQVEDLFRRFEQAGDRAYAEKRQLVDRIIEELSKHAAVEEQVFYPATRMTVPGTDDIVLESVEEHHIVKWELDELKDLDPRDERFDAKVTVLIENVRHHVDEEESEYFPKVRKELGRNDLNELGDAMELARKVAPTRPHPRLPQVRPFNIIAGLVAGASDLVGDTIKGVAQGSVTAAKDVVSRVTGRRVGQAAPTGSSRTRLQAVQVREAADDAVEQVTSTAKKVAGDVEDTTVAARRAAEAAGKGAKRTAKSATRGAARTASAASSGAKGTATTAKKSAAATRTTAKRAATTTGRTATKAASSTRRTAKGAATATRKAAAS